MRHLLWLCPDAPTRRALAELAAGIKSAAGDALVPVAPHVTLASGPSLDAPRLALSACARDLRGLSLQTCGPVQAPDTGSATFRVRTSLYVDLTATSQLAALQAHCCAAIPGMAAPSGRGLHLSLGYTLASAASKASWLREAVVPATLRFDTLALYEDFDGDDFLARARRWHRVASAALTS